MRVYRVEFPDSRGPWHSEHARGLDIHPDPNSPCWQPSPREDKCGPIWSNEVCGCRTLTQLRAWFSHIWEDMEQMGAIVAEYHIPGSAVRSGKWQVVFDPGDAVSRAERPNMQPLRSNRK